MFLKVQKNNYYLKELKEISKDFSRMYNLDISLTPDLDLDFGVTNFNNNLKTLNILVGTKNYLFQNDPEYIFAQTLIILYHELQHYEQNNLVYKGNATKELFFNTISSNMKNRDYYNQNYHYDFRELDANYVSIHKAYERIRSQYPEINALNMIKKYMLNHSIFKEYIKEIENVFSMEELDQFVFEPMFDRLPSIPKTIDRCSSEKSKYHTPDEFLLPFQEYCNDRDIYYPDLLMRAKCNTSENINFLSDKIIGTVMTHLHPEYEELLKKNNLKEQSLDEVMQELRNLAYEPPGRP